MSKLTIVAKLAAKKESVENVKIELLKLIAPTRKESGCIEYNLCQDNDNPAVFVFYETWENTAAFENHKKTDHYQAYVGAVANMIADKNVNKMTVLDN